MIGNYINIDYDKLPRRKQEEVKEPEKDYSSIGKLLQHPQYKDIIGLYTGKSKAEPVVSMADAYALTPNTSIGVEGPYASGGGGGGRIAPMVGVGAASTLGAKALKNLRNKKAEEPQLGTSPKVEEEPEAGIEGEAEEAKLDNGIEGNLQTQFFDALKDLDISLDDLKKLTELYNNGLLDDSSVELFGGLSKDDPDYQELVDLLKQIIRKYPDIVEYINPNDMHDDDNNDDNDDEDNALKRFVNKAREIFKNRKEKLGKDFNKFEKTDPKTKRNMDIAKNKANIEKKYDYVDRSKMDSGVNKYDASKAKTENITREKPQFEKAESEIQNRPDYKSNSERADIYRNWNKMQKGTEIKTPWDKDKVSPWNK